LKPKKPATRNRINSYRLRFKMGIVDNESNVSTECQACQLYNTECFGRPAGHPCKNEMKKRGNAASQSIDFDSYGLDCLGGMGML